MQKLIILCLAAAFAAPSVVADSCKPEEYLKLYPLVSNPHIKPCQEQSGFSLMPPSGYPTPGQFAKICASASCVSLLNDVKAVKPADCELTIGQLKFNPKKLTDEFDTACRQPTAL